MAFLVIKKSPKGFQDKSLIIVVSKRVSKKAVDRNLIKRRIKSAAIPLLDKLENDITIIAKPGISKLTFEEIKKDIHESII